MSRANPLTIMRDVRSGLQLVAPTFIRDTTPENANLPDELIMLDHISSPTSNDFDAPYDTITLQVGVWTKSLSTSELLLNQANDIMLADGWKRTAFRAPFADGRYRGAQADYEREY